MASAPVIEVRGVFKSFGPVNVLKDVKFDAVAGEVTALVGDNGAGKSTLIKGLAGIQPFDSGEFFFEGKKVSVNDPREAAALGIEVVYQDLALCDNLDVVANMFLGREKSNLGVMDDAAMVARAGDTLKGLAVRTITSLQQKVSSLSGGQRQTVAIARAVLWNNKVVILDEPTAALGVAQTAQVLKLARGLADKGLSVVFISHNLNDVFEVADRIVVLYLGEVAADLRKSETNEDEVVGYITRGRAQRESSAA